MEGNFEWKVAYWNLKASPNCRIFSWSTTEKHAHYRRLEWKGWPQKHFKAIVRHDPAGIRDGCLPLSSARQSIFTRSSRVSGYPYFSGLPHLHSNSRWVPFSFERFNSSNFSLTSSTIRTASSFASHFCWNLREFSNSYQIEKYHLWPF